MLLGEARRWSLLGGIQGCWTLVGGIDGDCVRLFDGAEGCWMLLGGADSDCCKSSESECNRSVHDHKCSRSFRQELLGCTYGTFL